MELIIGDRTIRRVISYAIDSNIYNAAGAFNVSLHPSYISQVNKGDRVTIRINGSTILTGLVDNPKVHGSRNSVNFTVYGRDLMGLVVDYHLESFRTIKNKTLAQVAELYLREIDYVRDLQILFLDGADRLDVAQEYVQPQPGQTVFELLSGIASARGMHFYMRPDGTMVFGKPKGFGKETFFIYNADGNGNVIDFEKNDDASQQYSRVVVIGQQRSSIDTGTQVLNKKATVTDPAFPFTKPLVVTTDTAAKTPEAQARMIMEQQRIDGFNVSYTVGGHSQRGNLWQPDTICAVDDQRLGLREELVVYGRTFNFERSRKTTKIVLGKMGYRAAA